MAYRNLRILGVEREIFEDLRELMHEECALIQAYFGGDTNSDFTEKFTVSVAGMAVEVPTRKMASFLNSKRTSSLDDFETPGKLLFFLHKLKTFFMREETTRPQEFFSQDPTKRTSTNDALTLFDIYYKGKSDLDNDSYEPGPLTLTYF
jgi:hypothetical protein